MVAGVGSEEQTHALWGGSEDERKGHRLGKFCRLRRQRTTPGVLMENFIFFRSEYNLTLSSAIYSDFVMKYSYGESWDSSCEKS